MYGTPLTHAVTDDLSRPAQRPDTAIGMQLNKNMKPMNVKSTAGLIQRHIDALGSYLTWNTRESGHRFQNAYFLTPGLYVTGNLAVEADLCSRSEIHIPLAGWIRTMIDRTRTSRQAHFMRSSPRSLVCVNVRSNRGTGRVTSFIQP